jgi:hypothetical protein
MNVDKTLLTPEQRREVKAWEEFFVSAAYRLFQQRFGERYRGVGPAYRAATGAQALGKVQGRDEILREVANLEQVLELEFQHLTGQVEREAREAEEAKGAMA